MSHRPNKLWVIMPYHRYRAPLKAVARSLRKNMPEPERKLWFEFLSGHPIRFLRQKPIGAFIVDFYCAARQLAIEIDGDSHYATAATKQDEVRSRWLQSQGIAVVRFSNEEVLRNFEGVCAEIQRLVSGSD